MVKMKIVARYRSRCRICGGNIEPGEQIEWERGKGSAHVECTKQVEAKETSDRG